MKKILIIFAFVFATATTFSSTRTDLLAERSTNCTHVKLSCDVEYDICNFKGTTTQLLNSILNANNNICGTDFEMFH